jgi:hypothetical protein
MPGCKRRRKNKGGAAVAARARLTRVRLGKKKKKEKKASSGPPGESASTEQPLYLVVEHGVEDPTHSVLEVAAGAAPHPLLYGKRGMSFAAVGSRDGPRIVGLGFDRTSIYDPKTFTEVLGPRLLRPMMDPVLIPHGSELYALSRCPAVVGEVEFMPWFFVFDLNLPYVGGATGWREMPPPPVFPCRLNPLEYRNPPEIRVASYAMVGSHIVLSVQQDKGTCAFDVDNKKWEMVDSKNLPFIGHAVPLGDHRFVACSKARDGAAAVFSMEVVLPGTTSTGKTELSITELLVESKGIVPGHFWCAMGMGRFSSFDVRSVDPGPEGKLEKARIVHRTYSQVEGDDARTNSVVIVKQQRQIYKLHDRSCHLAYPLPVVAALTL